MNRQKNQCACVGERGISRCNQKNRDELESGILRNTSDDFISVMVCFN